MAFPDLSMSTPPEPTTATIGPIGQARQVREWTLVLSSMNIPHAVREGGDGWTLLVATSDLDRALRAVRLYEAENRNWPPPQVRERLPHARSLIAPLLMLGLVLFYSVTGPASESSAWFVRGTASSERILHGEIWRAVTALTLHADTLHVLGNALSGSIFLSAVNRRLGDGRGPLLMVVAGALGNIVNAAWYRTGHLSIGASTAVFSAVGLLAATQLALDRGQGPRPWLERVAPVVGGLALLGMMGASPHTDVLAHLFGLGAGLFVGILATLGMRKPSQKGPRWVQIASALGLVALLAGSWLLAFHAPRGLL